MRSEDAENATNVWNLLLTSLCRFSRGHKRDPRKNHLEKGKKAEKSQESLVNLVVTCSSFVFLAFTKTSGNHQRSIVVLIFFAHGTTSPRPTVSAL